MQLYESSLIIKTRKNVPYVPAVNYFTSCKMLSCYNSHILNKQSINTTFSPNQEATRNAYWCC